MFRGTPEHRRAKQFLSFLWMEASVHFGETVALCSPTAADARATEAAFLDWFERRNGWRPTLQVVDLDDLPSGLSPSEVLIDGESLPPASPREKEEQG